MQAFWNRFFPPQNQIPWVKTREHKEFKSDGLDNWWYFFPAEPSSIWHTSRLDILTVSNSVLICPLGRSVQHFKTWNQSGWFPEPQTFLEPCELSEEVTPMLIMLFHNFSKLDTSQPPSLNSPGRHSSSHFSPLWKEPPPGTLQHQSHCFGRDHGIPHQRSSSTSCTSNCFTARLTDILLCSRTPSSVG